MKIVNCINNNKLTIRVWLPKAKNYGHVSIEGHGKNAFYASLWPVNSNKSSYEVNSCFKSYKEDTWLERAKSTDKPKEPDYCENLFIFDTAKIKTLLHLFEEKCKCNKLKWCATAKSHLHERYSLSEILQSESILKFNCVSFCSQLMFAGRSESIEPALLKAGFELLKALQETQLFYLQAFLVWFLPHYLLRFWQHNFQLNDSPEIILLFCKNLKKYEQEHYHSICRNDDYTEEANAWAQVGIYMTLLGRGASEESAKSLVNYISNFIHSDNKKILDSKIIKKKLENRIFNPTQNFALAFFKKKGGVIKAVLECKALEYTENITNLREKIEILRCNIQSS